MLLPSWWYQLLLNRVIVPSRIFQKPILSPGDCRKGENWICGDHTFAREEEGPLFKMSEQTPALNPADAAVTGEHLENAVGPTAQEEPGSPALKSDQPKEAAETDLQKASAQFVHSV